MPRFYDTPYTPTTYHGTYGSRVKSKAKSPKAYLKRGSNYRNAKLSSTRLFSGGAGGAGSYAMAGIKRPPSSSRGRRSTAPGLFSRSRMSTRKIAKRAAGNSTKRRLVTLLDTLEPTCRLEEHFYADSGNTAPPMVDLKIGNKLQQLMVSGQSLPSVSALGSQLVEECVYYKAHEQALLLKAAQELILPVTTSGHMVYPINHANQFHNNFHFNFLGATNTHKFVNTGVTQCMFTVYEWQPRRYTHEELTPIALWKRDLVNAVSGTGKDMSTDAPPNNTIKPIDIEALRTPFRYGARPTKLSCPSLYYSYKLLSKKFVSLQPGQEHTYVQRFAPYCLTSEFLRISADIDSFNNADYVTMYNRHSRWLMIIAHGEQGVFSSASASVMSNQSWQMGHKQVRHSSFKGSIPGKRNMRIVVDRDTSATTSDFLTETDMNEEGDNISTVQGTAVTSKFQMV